MLISYLMKTEDKIKFSLLDFKLLIIIKYLVLTRIIYLMNKYFPNLI